MYFDEVIESLASDDVSTQVAKAAEVVRAAPSRAVNAEELQLLTELALDSEASELLEVALEKVIRTEPRVAKLFFDVARTTAARRKLAAHLDQDEN